MNVGLWLEARLRARSVEFPREAPRFADIQRFPSVFEAAAKGDSLSLMGETFRKPAVALGQILARQRSKRIVPGTREYKNHWFGLEFENTVSLAYGFRDQHGRIRIHLKSSGGFPSTEWLTPSYGGAIGEEALVVYDLAGPAVVALSLLASQDAGPVRTGFRKDV
jgi:hypothetical protein